MGGSAKFGQLPRHFSDQVGSRFAWHQRQDDNAAAAEFNGVAFGLIQGVQCVIAALHVDVRLNELNESISACFGENGDPIDAFEGGDDDGAITLRVEWACWSFKGTD